MSTNAQTLVAGEPIRNLLEGLEQFDLARSDDGAIRGDFRLEGEVGASWLRAVERYGVDFITADFHDDLAQRHADTFLQISDEIVAVMGLQDSK